MAASDQTPPRTTPTIQKIGYTHDAMIDQIIAQPDISQNALGQLFGYTPGWVSIIKNSDAFQARLAERRAEIVDPSLVATVDERLRAVADASLERLLERVTSPVKPSDDFLLQSAKLSTAALGYGAKAPAAGGVTNNVAVVIQVPPKMASSSDWAAAHAPQLVPRSA